MPTPNQSNAAQTRYNLTDPLLRAVQKVFVQKRFLEYDDLHEASSNFDLNAIEFSEQESEEILLQAGLNSHF